uniref:Uncharacterized protein n=1 Tax=Triticum urartu TaxID=4572 RepID=A0A8R7V4K2_TRIUA
MYHSNGKTSQECTGCIVSLILRHDGLDSLQSWFRSTGRSSITCVFKPIMFQRTHWVFSHLHVLRHPCVIVFVDAYA